MKKTSLSDIAEALGVSKSLVSLVLNGRGDEVGINKDTQKRVLRMVKEMNYKPNMVARGLRLGISRTLGLIVPNIGNPFFAHIARVVEDEADKMGYRVMSVSSDEDPEKERALIKVLLERQIDGLILASCLKEKEEIRKLKEEKIPFVLIDRYFSKMKVNHIVLDNRAGARRVVDHLTQQGYRRIGLLKITPSHISSIRDRHEGYREGLRAHGIRYDRRLVRELPFDRVEEEMEEAVMTLLRPPAGADALFF